MKQQRSRSLSTQTMAYCALLAALSVVLARLVGLMPDASSRFSVEAVPVFLAGMLFGPLPGAMVGFSADLVGCLFSAYGYNPIFCVPPILYGLFGGIFRRFLAQKVSLPRLVLAFLPPIVLGSVLYQSATLAYMYYEGAFWDGFLLKLSTRSVQFAVTLVADVVLTRLLMRAGIFDRLGLWPPLCEAKQDRKDDRK